MADWIEAGDKAPDFTLATHDGTKLKLSNLRGKTVVLYFYPKDDTPGCTKEACGFRDTITELEASDAVVLGVSPDGPESHARFRKKYDLPFTLLADPTHAVAEKYGAWREKRLGEMARKPANSHLDWWKKDTISRFAIQPCPVCFSKRFRMLVCVALASCMNCET